MDRVYGASLLPDPVKRFYRSIEEQPGGITNTQFIVLFTLIMLWLYTLAAGTLALLSPDPKYRVFRPSQFFLTIIISVIVGFCYLIFKSGGTCFLPNRAEEYKRFAAAQEKKRKNAERRRLKEKGKGKKSR